MTITIPVGETVEFRSNVFEFEMLNSRGEVVATITPPRNGDPLFLTGVEGFTYRVI